jgi:chemotaxis protein methyltransferase CheR
MPVFNTRMTSSEFDRLSNFIYNEFGIKLLPVKKTMLESRLQKRLAALQITSYKEYCDYLFSQKGQQEEVVHMIDPVTTNKTDFFREAAHFDFLQSYVLPEFIRNYPGKQLKVWSAGCSSGEEPYTLGIVLSEFAELNRLADYSIFATDLSTQVLNKAITAVYSEDRIETIPLILKKKYFLKSKDSSRKTVRVVSKIRSKVSFQRLNFMDSQYEVQPDFDIIFCRNVIIYFDKPTQESVINKLCKQLKRGGYFFLGHSESITHMQLPLQQIKPTIFRKI